jgi:hypothetical protein
MWKVFLEEEGMSGRYKLIAEKPSRPAGATRSMVKQPMITTISNPWNFIQEQR